jgi:hypothetical protein
VFNDINGAPPCRKLLKPAGTRINEPVVNGFQARGVEMAQPRYLHRRRLAGKDQKPVARMARKVDQHIDARGSRSEVE